MGTPSIDVGVAMRGHPSKIHIQVNILMEDACVSMKDELADSDLDNKEGRLARGWMN